MKLFDLFRKENASEVKGNNKSDVLKPGLCIEILDDTVLSKINKIDWSRFHIAYGSAKDTVPYYLKNIFCSDESIALEATHQLWCSISHQGVNMTDAALPAYEILKSGLAILSDSVKVEILDIFTAFSLCTSKEYITVPNELVGWEKEIQQKLLRDKEFFHAFAQVSNEDIADNAKLIYSHLENQKN